jgi:uncharacterized pyridoxal phosphate-containing UPF0001 family protein
LNFIYEKFIARCDFSENYFSIIQDEVQGFHKDVFGMDAKWHFFGMLQGRGACDGIGGTIKRLASKASLQNPYEEQIMTPGQLYK